MAYTKAQLEALKNSLLASNQPITAAIHRSFAQKLIDELYDAQSRGNLLAGVQDSGATVAGDEILVIRSGQAYLIPASLFGSGISFEDLNGLVIVDPQDGDLISYNAITNTWDNIPNTFVPYDGATASVNLGEFGLRAGFIRFDTTPTGTPTDQGTVSWDVDNETLDVVLNGYTMKIGEDLFYPVKNQTGASIPKGTAVRFNGTVGASGRLLIAPFLADGSQPSSRFMGVTAEEIADGEDGKVLWFGRLRGINTNAFNEGDILYASTTVAGGFQTAVPTPQNNVISVAAVISKSITQGVLFVRPQIEGVVGPGTTNRLAKFINANAVGNSLIEDNGSQIGYNTAPAFGHVHAFKIGPNLFLSFDDNRFTSLTINAYNDAGGNIDLVYSAINHIFDGFGNKIMTLVGSSGNVLIGTDTDAGQKIQIEGSAAIRAAATASPATQIPVFIANPASNRREIVTRTPAQLASDMGLVSQSTGTFTPTLTDQGGGTGYTYTLSAANGFWIKTGRLVFINIYIAVTSTSGASGVGGLVVGNLPFTSEATSANNSGLVIHKMSGTNWSDLILDRLACSVASGVNTIGFTQLTSVGGNAAPVITSGTIFISGCYYANS